MHTGLTADPAAETERLLSVLVLRTCRSPGRARQARAAAQRGGDQPVDQRRVVDAGGRPHPREHRDRREAGHRVDLVDDDRGRRRVTKKSTRARPAQSSAVNARQAASLHRGGDASGGRSAGMSNSQASSRYLASKSYQSWPASQPDLGRHAGLGQPVGVLEHAALDLAAGDRRPRRAPWCRARTPRSTASASSAQSSTRVMPTLDPARAGLTNTGSPRSLQVDGATTAARGAARRTGRRRGRRPAAGSW